MNIPYFDIIKDHPFVGKTYIGILDNYTFICTGVIEVDNGTILLSNTQEHICQYYQHECKEKTLS